MNALRKCGANQVTPLDGRLFDGCHTKRCVGHVASGSSYPPSALRISVFWMCCVIKSMKSRAHNRVDVV